MSDVERIGSTTNLTVSSSCSRAILWWLVLNDSCVPTRVSSLTWLSVKWSCSLSGTKTYTGTLIFLYWHNSLLLGVLLLCLWSGEGGKDCIAFVRAMNASTVVLLEEYKYRCLGAALGLQSSWSTVGCCSSDCLSKSEIKIESAKKILNKIDFFFRTYCRHST